MIYAEGLLLAEVILLVITLRREDGQVLTITTDADGNPRSVEDNTGYSLGVDELTKTERRALKRLVEVD